MVVLDDLHAADGPSLLLLRFVAAGDRGSSGAGRRAPTATSTRRSASRSARRWPSSCGSPAACGWSSPGWAGADVAAYIASTTGTEPDDRLAAAIHAETEGNPLFVGEVVRLLVAEGRLTDADAHLRIPPGVRAVIGERLGRLSPPCRDVLVARVRARAASSASTRSCSWPATRATRCSTCSTRRIGERVVADVPGSASRLRFAHALIRDTLYDGLTTARRSRLHERAGEALEAVYAADPEPHLAELAQHFVAAAPGGTARRRVAYARRAGDARDAQLAYEEAVRHCEIALELATDPAVRCDLLLALGDARARAGDTPRRRRRSSTPPTSPSAGTCPSSSRRAALGYGGRMIWEVSRDDERLVPLLERALAALGHGGQHAARAAARPARRRPAARRAASRRARRRAEPEALEMARRIGDPATLAYAIQGYILGHHSPAHTPRQLELAGELSRSRPPPARPSASSKGSRSASTRCIELGDMAGREGGPRARWRRIARELRQPAQAWLVAVYGALVALLEGRFDEAGELVAHARALGERAQSWNAEVTYRLQLYVLRREQGRLDEVDGARAAVGRRVPDVPDLALRAGRSGAELGPAPGTARATLDELAARRVRRLPFDEEWLVGMGLLAETATRSATPTARPSLRAAAPYGDRVAVSYPEIWTGAVARNLGLLATALRALGRGREPLRGGDRAQRAGRGAAVGRPQPRTTARGCSSPAARPATPTRRVRRSRGRAPPTRRSGWRGTPRAPARRPARPVRLAG